MGTDAPRTDFSPLKKSTSSKKSKLLIYEICRIAAAQCQTHRLQDPDDITQATYAHCLAHPPRNRSNPFAYYLTISKRHIITTITRQQASRHRCRVDTRTLHQGQPKPLAHSAMQSPAAHRWTKADRQYTFETISLLIRNAQGHDESEYARGILDGLTACKARLFRMGKNAE